MSKATRLPMFDEEKLDELADRAGEMDFESSFQEPPKQWLPAIIRWPVRVIILPFILLDIFTQVIAKFLIPPPYKRVGKCKKRGNCCYYIFIGDPGNLLGKLHHIWNTQVNGFFDRIGKITHYAGKRGRLYGCRYLQKSGKCGCHKLRPSICRKWPLIHHFGRPQILKGCGFMPKSKNPLLNLDSVEEDMSTIRDKES